MTLTARNATVDDAELLWQWRNDPETRRRSFTKTPIAYVDHVAWLARKVGAAHAAIWIFSDQAEPVGQVRADVDAGVAEVSIIVAPLHRGRGHGKTMLAAATRLIRRRFGEGLRLRALVLEQSAVSLKLFAGCGFQVVGPTVREGQGALILEREDTSIAATGVRKEHAHE